MAARMNAGALSALPRRSIVESILQFFNRRFDRTRANYVKM
ncbi:hypothetical protein [Microcoleus sp.]